MLSATQHLRQARWVAKSATQATPAELVLYPNFNLLAADFQKWLWFGY